jgi:hypothetical protein
MQETISVMPPWPKSIEFSDLYSPSQLPALERNEIRLRAFKMILALFYIEELKRCVRFIAQAIHPEETTSETKYSNKKVEKKDNYELIKRKGYISELEYQYIKEIIDYRNMIGHEIHELFSDISPEKFIREINSYQSTEYTDKYNAILNIMKEHKIIDKNYVAKSSKKNKAKTNKKIFDEEKIRSLLCKIRNIPFEHSYLMSIDLNNFIFATSERVLVSDIKKLQQKVDKLKIDRIELIKKLNEEMKEFNCTIVQGHPSHPKNKNKKGHLTRQGQDVCFNLFNSNKSVMAVALMMQIKLESARRWQKFWLKKSSI